MPTHSPEIESQRLVRSLDLDVSPRAGSDIYDVTGQSGRTYVVRLGETTRPKCNCPDSIYRHNTRCKHLLAVQGYIGAADLVRPLEAIGVEL